MNDVTTAWVLDDDASMRWVLERALTDAGVQVRVFESAAGVRQALQYGTPDVLLSDVRMPGEDGMALLAHLVEHQPGLPVIIMTAHSDLDAAVAAYEGGAFEYLPKPFDIDAMVALVQRASTHTRAVTATAPTIDEGEPELIGEAPAMQQVYRAIGRLQRSHVPVLITGETGTGKELVARALHRHGPRAGGPFVALNAAAIPPELVESELFGHERGAYTGAHAQRIGRFEQADGGTLFLDEIGDMPAAAQTRLLRVLAEGELHRVGGNRTVPVDVRVIAATHQQLSKLVEDGRFRSDLYHRLNVVALHLPSLRERCEDIPLLFGHFLQRAAAELGVAPKTPAPGLTNWLERLRWPGNVRELENLCRRLTAMAPGRVVHIDDLPAELRPDGGAEPSPGWEHLLTAWAEEQLDNGATGLAPRMTETAERILIEAALRRTGGQRAEAAKLLGWGRNTLARKLKSGQ
ncbi:MAG: nitrogen regulation protein NR(I) [Xanthomonadaceae bacterium]|nr:nitrogen regulation protein NR(I) [Xanthomonadaceae bacterium]